MFLFTYLCISNEKCNEEINKLVRNWKINSVHCSFWKCHTSSFEPSMLNTKSTWDGIILSKLKQIN